MEPLLTKYVREPNSFTLDFYLQHQGYDGLRKALALKPEAVIDLVKASGLRGRGGAGFPTGMKWQFVDKKSPNPKYIACNADESEPGTFKDHLLMERNPHLLIEGCAIGCYAIGATIAYIYIRGEFLHVQHILERAIDEAYARGFLGKNVLGSGFDCDVYVHRGAGAYEAGEETALLESLEGKRAQPRNKPPFPAVVGLYNCPTAVNNVETLANVPLILLNGAEWFAGLGPEKNGGPKLYCISGHVKRPGVYEASMSVTLRELIEGKAGGARDGRTIKAVIPGGSSVPILLPEPARRAGQLRRRAEGGIAARIGGAGRARRHHLHGVAGREPAAFLPPRIVRQVHAVPRGDRLAAPDPPAHRARRGADAGSGFVVEHFGQRRRQDAVRVRRRRRDTGVDDAEAFPARVRSAHPGRTLHAARRVAWASQPVGAH